MPLGWDVIALFAAWAIAPRLATWPCFKDAMSVWNGFLEILAPRSATWPCFKDAMLVRNGFLVSTVRGVIETAHCFLPGIFLRFFFFCRYGKMEPTLEPISGEAEMLLGRAYRGQICQEMVLSPVD
ncbi:unnamed protein product [Laminaria digitata]